VLAVKHIRGGKERGREGGRKGGKGKAQVDVIGY